MSAPRYWEVLPDKDRPLYIAMRRSFTELIAHEKRHEETFSKMISQIKTFSHRREEDDWRRFLVCGICWMDSVIGINMRQLRCLITKCKSTINSGLQKMGYVTPMSQSNVASFLSPMIPLLGNSCELRQWSLRMNLTEMAYRIHRPVAAITVGQEVSPWP